MDSSYLKELITKTYNQNRLVHTLGVYDVITELAIKHNIDLEKARIAALFHDYAKGTMSIDEQKEYISNYMNKELLREHYNLYHGFIAADIMKYQFNYDDEEVYNAIYYHVTGISDMTDLGKILIISDTCEPNRPDNVDKELIKQTSLSNIDEGLKIAMKTRNEYLEGKKGKLHENTIKLSKELGVY